MIQENGPSGQQVGYTLLHREAPVTFEKWVDMGPHIITPGLPLLSCRQAKQRATKQLGFEQSEQQFGNETGVKGEER